MYWFDTEGCSKGFVKNVVDSSFTKMSDEKSSKEKAQKDANYTRQDLMKLSLKDLQKICKKNKFKSKKNATKMDMINVIICSSKKKKKNKKKNELTPSQQGEYLASRYMRNVTKYSRPRQKYDHQLTIIIAEYIGHELFMCFDVCPSKYDKDIRANGKIIQRGMYTFGHSVTRCSRRGGNTKMRQKQEYSRDNVWILYGSSMGMDEGIHEWNIKVIKYDEDKSINDEFGVTDNISLCRGQNHWGFKKENVYSSRVGNIKQDDVIKLILNCDTGTLSFRIDDRNINGVINLRLNCKFYPVILSKCNKTKYKLLNH